MDFPDFAQALDRRWRSAPDTSVSPDLITLRSVASTHLLGRRIAEEYSRDHLSPPAVDIVAWEQTAGVGRDGRPWRSPAGKGIYLTSIRTMPSRESRRGGIQRLPLSVPVALCGAVNRLLTGEELPAEGGCRIKWPNDLQIGDRKLAGILIDVLGGARRRASATEPSAVKERRSRRRGQSIVILSVGANLDRDRESFGEAQATSLDYEGARRGRGPFAADEVAAELAAAVSEAVAAEHDPDELVERYRSFSLHRPGEPMQCRIDSEVVEGTFEGFDRFGFLELRVGGERRRISSGVIVGGD